MRASAAVRPSRDRLIHALRHGAITLTGQLVESSNGALLGSVAGPTGPITCVYKPVAFERPLWDFPVGTLAGRERAAYLVSRLAGWDCVPPTVLRDGPFGPGMVQRWLDDARRDAAAGLFEPDAVPAGWHRVLHGQDRDGRPVVLAHVDDTALAVLAAFDVVVNNADRKAGHILVDPDGSIVGVDHGLTFHRDPKLRSILWGWVGGPLPAPVLRGLERLSSALDPDAPAGYAPEMVAELADLLTDAELDALRRRIAVLRHTGTFPAPPDDRSPIPWPPL